MDLDPVGYEARFILCAAVNRMLWNRPHSDYVYFVARSGKRTRQFGHGASRHPRDWRKMQADDQYAHRFTMA